VRNMFDPRLFDPQKQSHAMDPFCYTYVFVYAYAHMHLHMHIQIHMYSRMDPLHEIVFEDQTNVDQTYFAPHWVLGLAKPQPHDHI
jgi:hypothetical protein